MAAYKTAGKRTWPGAWATTPAQAQIVDGVSAAAATAFQIQSWLKAGLIVSGDTVLLDGRYPLTLDDAADWPSTSMPAITAPIVDSGAGNRPDTSAQYGRNIHFGNVSDNSLGTSVANGVSFIAEGADANGYNVDMRGATSNDQRQAAALMFEGINIEITGFKIRVSDWNFAAAGRIPASAAIGGASSSRRYVAEASWENLGIWIRGGWGCNIHDNKVDGGNFGHTGIYVGLKMEGSGYNLNANANVAVHHNECYSFGAVGISVQGGAGMNSSGKNRMPIGSSADVYNNICRDGNWGPGGSINNAIYDHGNLMGLYLCALNGSRVAVHHNEFSGDCQDALVTVGANTDLYDNTFNNISPGLTLGGTVPTFYGIDAGSTAPGFAAGWDNRTGNVSGNCIKMGLAGATYQGTPGADWMLLGVASGSGYMIDEPRCRAYRNRMDDYAGYGITGNGARSFIAVANEMRTTRGGGITGGAASVGGKSNFWLANNYCEALRALEVYDEYRCYAFSNVFKGSTNSAYVTGAGALVYGSNNVLDGSTSGTFQWANNTAAPAGYVFGVGPVSGGNCDGTGMSYGLLQSVTPIASAMALDDKPWDFGALPIGPRLPV